MIQKKKKKLLQSNSMEDVLKRTFPDYTKKRHKDFLFLYNEVFSKIGGKSRVMFVD